MKLLITLFTLCAFSSFAQIQFQHITLKAAKEQAKQQNKPIFVDVYATWCGPCKYMASTAFVDTDVAAYYNKEFINVKIDGEKEDGPSVMTEYGISAYPTLLYIKPDGSTAETYVGAADAKTLKRLGIKIAHPDQDPVKIALNTYQKSKKDKESLITLVSTLNQNDADSVSYYATMALSQIGNVDFSNELERMIFFKGETDPFSKNCDSFLNNLNILEPKSAHDFMVRMILESHQKGMDTDNFELSEKPLRKYYPYIVQLGLLNLPDVESLVTQFRMEFDAN